MTENLVARDLMLTSFSTVRVDQTLAEAMAVLVENQDDADVPNALVVLDAEGGYVGLLTARLLFKSLLTLWMPARAVRKDDELLERELLTVVGDRSKLKVQDTLIRGLPTASPGDRLLALIDLACDQQLEFLAVVDGGCVLGLVPVTEIFQASASLALTPDDEGIQME